MPAETGYPSITTVVWCKRPLLSHQHHESLVTARDVVGAWKNANFYNSSKSRMCRCLRLEIARGPYEPGMKRACNSLKPMSE